MRLRTLIPVFAILLFFFLSLFVLDSNSKAREGALNLALAADYPATFTGEPSLPVKLEIPSIGVSASVESLGLTSSGAMDAPAGPKNVGWFNQGPVPGKVGASVIDGHSGWREGKAVFDDLHKVKVGDKIHVQDSNNQIFTFVVKELRYYDKDADTREVFRLDDGKSHLHLITCAGEWDSSTRTSSKRLVVFTDLDVN